MLKLIVLPRGFPAGDGPFPEAGGSPFMKGRPMSEYAEVNPRKYSLKTFRVTYSVEDPDPDLAVTNSLESAALARTILEKLDVDQEHMIMLTLNHKNVVYGYKIISSGTGSMSLVDPRMIYKAALVLNALAIILAHNHPSGNPSPSAEDKESTSRCLRAGKLINIRLLDSLIIGSPGNYFSFADAGLLEVI